MDRKSFKALPVTVQSGSPQCLSASPEQGVQAEPQLVESSQTSTPKTSQAAWHGLRRTITMFNSQLQPATVFQSKTNSLLNTSWPSSKIKRKLKPLPVCVSAKKRFSTAMDSKLNATHSESQNENHATQVTTPKSRPRSWHPFMPEIFSNNSIYGKDSENISIESTPNTQVTVSSRGINQTPSTSKQIKPKSKQRFVKGGFVQEYKTMLENMAMERRHLSTKKPSHIVNVLRIWESFGVKMALVRSETEPESGPTVFNIILRSDLIDSVVVGLRLKLYLNKEPIRLANTQFLHLHSNKVTLL